MYQSIYRKYRPQTFEEVYGQDAISKTLKNAIIYDRVAHAYLFSGPRGTGKTTSAKLLAKALNCTNMVDGVICDTCENCQLIKEGAHPDVIEIDAASNNGVDEVRDLIEKVKYAPIKGNKKVYIIDEVHMMTQGAFNALLKTLEEPPDHVCFILATTEIHKVLPTIKSRCQKFNFKKIQAQDIVACMKDVLDKEDALYEDQALEVIASLSDGGMRDALSTLEQVMIFSNNNITLAKTYEALDLVSLDNVKEIYQLILAKKLKETLDFINELNTQAVDFKQVINELINLAMDDLVASNGDKKYLLNMVEKLDESLEKLKYDNSKKLYLELAIIKSINYLNAPIVEAVNPTVQDIVAQNLVEEKPKKDDKIIQNYQRVLSSIPTEKPSVDLSENKVKEAISIYSDDEVMNVLVNANKDKLKDVKVKWTLIDDFLYRDDTKHAAGYLVDSIPVAACSNAIIVVSEDVANNQLINNSSNVVAINELLEKIYDEKHFVFALTQKKWNNIRDQYIMMLKNKTLPAPKPILEGMSFESESAPEVEEDELLVFGKRVFQDKLVINEKREVNNYEH